MDVKTEREREVFLLVKWLLMTVNSAEQYHSNNPFSLNWLFNIPFHRPFRLSHTTQLLTSTLPPLHRQEGYWNRSELYELISTILDPSVTAALISPSTLRISSHQLLLIRMLTSINICSRISPCINRLSE